MKSKSFDSLSDEGLASAFEKWADAAGEATLVGDRQKMRQAAYRLRDLSDVFRARGREARLILLPLLDHPKQGVRYYVAKHLLAIAPERARSVIEQVAAVGGPIAGAAGMTLHALDTGIFKPD
ncbi:MAG TPA: DUF2019 domain-containing protein [Alphaproteobacteria bacterium]|nr:DUF2019 domain-containing protein [Alphaproteobacteria bacterium]